MMGFETKAAAVLFHHSTIPSFQINMVFIPAVRS
jgi:hypothetical protein